MANIRQRDTAAELAVRRWLWAQGVRFRVRNHDLPGSPDLANRRKRWAVFVHGCFWHGHEGCSRATMPKRNGEFWRTKIAANRVRDSRKDDLLRADGYTVFTIWECETAESRSLITLLGRLRRAVARRAPEGRPPT